MLQVQWMLTMMTNEEVDLTAEKIRKVLEESIKENEGSFVKECIPGALYQITTNGMTTYMSGAALNEFDRLMKEEVAKFNIAPIPDNLTPTGEVIPEGLLEKMREQASPYTKLNMGVFIKAVKNK